VCQCSSIKKLLTYLLTYLRTTVTMTRGQTTRSTITTAQSISAPDSGTGGAPTVE